MAEHSIFAIMDALENGPPFSPPAVRAAIGLFLRPVAEESDEYTITFVGTGLAGSPIASLELRVPNKPSTGTRGLLILQLAPTVQLTTAEVVARYGMNTGLAVPTPHQPPESPVYYEYARPWGKLSFGFSRTEPELLSTVVLDSSP